jgi:hypothetical protein
MALQNQRPRFYEGQYLGADDLQTIVEYLRAADARHALGGHTWGVGIGLSLLEKSAPGAPNRVEVTLLPGFAWDGFGRPLVNERPTRLPESLFADIPFHPTLDDVTAGGKGRLVPVWLTYDETSSRGPSPGFETCATDDQHARVGETSRFVIGEQTALQQRSQITIGTNTLDAQQALHTFDATAPLLFDTSVPHQTFPAGKPPRWLIPLGYVRWIARDQALGYFAERNLNPSDNVADRIRGLRRYVGVVAEYIEAADNAIVLHRRGERPDLAHRFANLLKGGFKASDLVKDLVWVEGNLRVEGDAKLAAGQLLLRDGQGLDQGTPLYIARHGDNPPSGTPGQRELRVVIGDGTQTDNRLIVGPEQAGASPPPIAPNLVVVSSGRVGVATRTPNAPLEVAGNWTGTEGAVRISGDQPTIRFEGGPPAADQKWIAQVGSDGPGNFRIAFLTPAAAWQAVLHVTTTDRAGIRTPNPRNPLGIRASGTWEELVSFEDANGVTKWHINQKANGTTPGLNFVETGVPDGDGRIFIKAGGDVGIGTLAPAGRLTLNGKVPQHGVMHFFTPTTDVEYDGGSDALFLFRHLSNGITSFIQTQFGINTTHPYGTVGVRGRLASEELLSFEDAAGNTRWHLNSALAGGPRGLNFAETGIADGRLFLREGGNVGIGTRAPLQKLHVAGPFVRVDGAGNEQAYLGGDGAGSDVQVGSMNAGIMRLAVWNTSVGGLMDFRCRDILCDDLTTSLVTIPSDAALKDEIAPIRGALTTLERLRGVQFQWKAAKGRPPRKDFGLIAQEVAKVVPQLVRQTESGASVAYLSLIPLLIESVKELKSQVESLKADVARLSRPARGRASKTKKKQPVKKAEE